MSLFFNMPNNIESKVFLDENGDISKNWKEFWNIRQKDPSIRRQVRQEKAYTKKRIHRKSRKNTRIWLKNKY